jgi:indolepyruvate ferredoxin oxidoreductase beta subunit
MRPKKMDFLLAGVGGQGVLTASDIICEVGLAVGYDAKKSEVHGFSQRGGVVDSHVRWGEKVYAPLAEKGAVDVLLAFEALEAARWISFLKPGGLAIVNTQHLVPMSVMTTEAAYPPDESITSALRQVAKDVHFVDGLGLAEEIGNPRLANTVLLGALSSHLDIDPAVWLNTIDRRVPRKYVEANRLAFRAGRGQVPATF